MSAPTTVSVDLPQRSYEIQIGSGLIDELQDAFRQVTNCHHAILVSDENVAGIYLERVKRQLEKLFQVVSVIVVPAGEKSKSIGQLENIWNRLVDLGVDRQSTVVALGGGVVGDLAGFAAASFGRGIDLVQIPTSLLAQVDSSVGGKVGINLPTAKNMVGAFWQPRAVIIDPDVLQTLDDRNFRAGLAEVAKYGLALDASFFEFLSSNIAAINRKDTRCLEHIIAACCRIKARVVIDDERETTGIRALLNYGHTFGHAIEAVYGFGEYLHGEAIAIGMQCAVTMAAKMNVLQGDLQSRQTELFQQLGLQINLTVNRSDEIFSAMQRDKKVDAGTLKFVVPREIGRSELMAGPDKHIVIESISAHSAQES